MLKLQKFQSIILKYSTWESFKKLLIRKSQSKSPLDNQDCLILLYEKQDSKKRNLRIEGESHTEILCTKWIRSCWGEKASEHKQQSHRPSQHRKECSQTIPNCKNSNNHTSNIAGHLKIPLKKLRFKLQGLTETMKCKILSEEDALVMDCWNSGTGWGGILLFLGTATRPSWSAHVLFLETQLY